MARFPLALLLLHTALLATLAAADSPALDKCGQAGGPCGTPCSVNKQSCQAGYFCGGPADSGKDWPICLPVPAGCGQLGAKCCPSELRPGGLSAGNAGSSDTYPTPFCYAADVLCTAPSSSVTESECIKLPSNTTCGAPGQDCCPGFYHVSVDKPVPDMCAKGAYCGDSNKCVQNPADCGQEGKPCCIVSTSVAATAWCREKGYYCPFEVDVWPGTCTACPTPPPTDIQWQCQNPMGQDFTLPDAN